MPVSQSHQRLGAVSISADIGRSLTFPVTATFLSRSRPFVFREASHEYRRAGARIWGACKTIRYYEGIGLVPLPERTANGYRWYDEAIMDRLAFIRAAQASGLSLGEIRSVIAFRNRGETPCVHVRALIDQRAAEIDRRIAELQQIRADLARLAKRARRLDPAECDPASVCHIISTARRLTTPPPNNRQIV